MLKGMKLSCMVIANTVLFANISDFLKCVFVYIMTFSIVHRDTWDDSSHFNMQGEDFFLAYW